MSVSATRADRVRWADTAKGLCILLVVLWHVVAKQYLRLEWPEGLRVPGVWGTFCELLLPLRMPLFFTISGMFALNAVHRPWRISARSRVARFLYLYLVWLLIHTALLGLAPDFPTDRATGPAGLLEQLTITPSNLWYLYALALYFVIAKLTWRFPRVVMLGAAFALSVAAASELVPVPGNRAGLLQNLVFFLLGLYFRPYVERLADGVNLARFALATGVYGALLSAMAATGTEDVPGVWPVVCVAAAAFGVTGSAMLARWDRVAAPLIGIGRRTLPIYVIHMPVLALLDLALARPLAAALDTPFALPIAVLEPILLTAAISWFCLLCTAAWRRRGSAGSCSTCRAAPSPARRREPPAAAPGHAAAPAGVATPAGVAAHHPPAQPAVSPTARPAGAPAHRRLRPTVAGGPARPTGHAAARPQGHRVPGPAAAPHHSSPFRQDAPAAIRTRCPRAPAYPAGPGVRLQTPDAQATLPYGAYLAVARRPPPTGPADRPRSRTRRRTCRPARASRRRPARARWPGSAVALRRSRAAARGGARLLVRAAAGRPRRLLVAGIAR